MHECSQVIHSIVVVLLRQMPNRQYMYIFLLCYLYRFLTARRLLNFTVGLTDQDPRTGNGPLKSPFLKCATHGGIGAGETVSVTCTPPLYARRRYLFVAAKMDRYFHMREIEVFAGRLMSLYIEFIRPHYW